MIDGLYPTLARSWLSTKDLVLLNSTCQWPAWARNLPMSNLILSVGCVWSGCADPQVFNKWIRWLWENKFVANTVSISNKETPVFFKFDKFMMVARKLLLSGIKAVDYASSPVAHSTVVSVTILDCTPIVVIKMLQRCIPLHSIQEINISGCSLTDLCYYQLHRIFAKCHHLRSFVCDHEIPDIILLTLFRGISCKSLIELDVKPISVLLISCQAICYACPNLQKLCLRCQKLPCYPLVSSIFYLFHTTLPHLRHLELYYVLPCMYVYATKYLSSFTSLQNLYLPHFKMYLNVYVDILKALPNLLHFTTAHHTVDTVRLHLRIEDCSVPCHSLNSCSINAIKQDCVDFLFNYKPWKTVAFRLHVEYVKHTGKVVLSPFSSMLIVQRGNFRRISELHLTEGAIVATNDNALFKEFFQRLLSGCKALRKMWMDIGYTRFNVGCLRDLLEWLLFGISSNSNGSSGSGYEHHSLIAMPDASEERVTAAIPCSSYPVEFVSRRPINARYLKCGSFAELKHCSTLAACNVFNVFRAVSISCRCLTSLHLTSEDTNDLLKPLLQRNALSLQEFEWHHHPTSSSSRSSGMFPLNDFIPTLPLLRKLVIKGKQRIDLDDIPRVFEKCPALVDFRLFVGVKRELTNSEQNIVHQEQLMNVYGNKLKLEFS